MYERDAVKRICEVYSQATTVKSGKHFTTVNELTDQLPAVRPDTLMAAVELLARLGPYRGTKILSEEDKGAVLAGLFSVRVGIPLAMARRYTYGEMLISSGAVVVPLEMEYMDGHLMVNGLEAGDRVLLIDDTLSTGGTMVSLIRAIHAMGAKVVDIRVVVEKLGFGGRERLANELDLNVRAAIGILVDTEGKITIGEVMGLPVDEYWRQ